MRFLRVYTSDWINLDIDEQTAIGIDIVSFDVKEPENRKFSYSNEFNIPITNINKSVFDLVGDEQAVHFLQGEIQSNLYKSLRCEYYVDNSLIISGTCYISEVSDRISLFLKPDMSIFDTLKSISWMQFEDYFMQYLTFLGESTDDNPFSYSTSFDFDVVYSNFMQRFAYNGSSILRLLPQLNELDVVLPVPDKYYYPEIVYEAGTAIHNITKVENGIQLLGAKFGIKITHIFDFIVWYFKETQGIDVSITYEQTSIIKNAGVALRRVYVDNYASGTFGTSLLSITTSNNDKSSLQRTVAFKGKENNDYCVGLTLFDYLKSVAQLYGMRINQIQNKISFTKIIGTGQSEFKDDNFTGVPKFKPIVEGYKQVNYIGLEAHNASPYYVTDTVDDIIITNIRYKFIEDRFESKNLNIEKGYSDNVIYDKNFGYDTTTFLYTIKGFLPITYERHDWVRRSLSMAFWHEKALESFSHYLIGKHDFVNNKFVYTSSTYETVFYGYRENAGSHVTFVELQAERVTSINHFNSTTFYDNAVADIARMVKQPATYRVKKYLLNLEVDNLDMSQPVYIRHLNGWFIINKIEGYNPLSKEAVEEELIKLA